MSPGIRGAVAVVVAALLLLAMPGASLAGDGCDLCGMKLARYGKTAHRLHLTNGQTRTFCSFTCLTETLASTPAAKVSKTEVADYGTGAFVDTKSAAYVVGSDAPAVMSNVSVVAFASRAAADAFAAGHGGTVTDFPKTLDLVRRKQMPAVSDPSFTALPKPGKKVVISDAYWFTFEFDKKPTMGTVIVKVQVHAADGARVTSLDIKGDADMPSMKGAHAMANRFFKLNKKGDYLMPVDIVMPGDWEIYLTFYDKGKLLFRGKYAFDI
jgi:nitrous oxide reductase accessory protein NosL